MMVYLRRCKFIHEKAKFLKQYHFMLILRSFFFISSILFWFWIENLVRLSRNNRGQSAKVKVNQFTSTNHVFKSEKKIDFYYDFYLIFIGTVQQHKRRQLLLMLFPWQKLRENVHIINRFYNQQDPQRKWRKRRNNFPFFYHLNWSFLQNLSD